MIAKQQSRFKGDAIAKHDVFGQRGAKYKEMYMKKPNEKVRIERRPKRESAFTPGSFSGTDGEILHSPLSLSEVIYLVGSN